jgi:hypothetical protein
MSGKRGALEVHEHSYIDRNDRRSDIEHSHGGGDRPHRHAHCGPAHYTIDRDEWARTTGLKGGGRKRYTAAPTGPQMPAVEIEPEENTFRVVFVDDYEHGWAGAGVSREEFEAQRAAFIEDMAGGEPRGIVPARLHQTELHGPDGQVRR